MRRILNFSLAALLVLGTAYGCKKPEPLPTPVEKPDDKPEEKPDEPETPVKSDPVKVVLTTAQMANMSYTYNEGTDTYTITTTSDDPYVFSEPLANRLPDDCVILSFEYTSAKEVDDFDPVDLQVVGV